MSYPESHPPSPQPCGQSTAPSQLTAEAMPLPQLLDSAASHLESAQPLPCQLNEAELWFSAIPAEVEMAKSLCATCPVKATCLEAAVQRQEPWGVWGAELFESGVIIARKRPRGRPRKYPLAS